MKRTKLLSMALAILMLLSLMPIPTAYAASAKVSFPAEGDYYIVPEANSGFAIDVKGGGAAAAGTSIQLWEFNKTDAQIFHIKRVDGDWYTITHKRTGYVINVKDGNSYNDARLWLWPFDGTNACYFRFAAVGSSYVIQNRIGAQRIIDLDCARCFSGSVVHLWDTHLGLSARWKLVPVSSGSSNSSTTTDGCFPRYTGSSGSIASALSSMGINSSFSYRSQIAAANGIGSYSGTAYQNSTLLNLLKRGQLKRPGTSADAPSQPTQNTSGSLVSANLSRVSFIRQRGDNCKATAAAMAANLIAGRNRYSTYSMISSGINCRDLGKDVYTGSNGSRYYVTYKTDGYAGSLSALKSRIEAAVSNGLPIVVPVHSTTNSRICHHWVVLAGKDSRGNYLVVDPAGSGSGTMADHCKTMASLGYDFGLADYSPKHYGYISFAK